MQIFNVTLACVGQGQRKRPLRSSRPATTSLPAGYSLDDHSLDAVGLGSAQSFFLTDLTINTITVGTAFDDFIQGTSINDVICGVGGDDVITAMAGDDEVYGGVGVDTLEGGDNIDFVSGGENADTIYGSAAGGTVFVMGVTRCRAVTVATTFRW